jgi:hypothetical protein
MNWLSIKGGTFSHLFMPKTAQSLCSLGKIQNYQQSLEGGAQMCSVCYALAKRKGVVDDAGSWNSSYSSSRVVYGKQKRPYPTLAQLDGEGRDNW